jgi:hypothetical protein
MSSYRIRRLALLLACAATLLGCGWTNRAEMASYREINRQLAAQSRMQLSEIENLKSHTRQVEDQLIAAENALASFEQSAHAERGNDPAVLVDAHPLWKAASKEPAARGSRR